MVLLSIKKTNNLNLLSGLSAETGLDSGKMQLICKGHVIEDGMYYLFSLFLVHQCGINWAKIFIRPCLDLLML